ncbi:MAG: J domain-containing protein [Nitrospira sp.]|nr:MAG: J domain-containing protein [Nitrospira sp.]
MSLEPLTLTVTRNGADAELRVRSGHSILAGAITIEALDRLATLFQAEALALRRARNRIAIPTHYVTLGVFRDATADEIQAAYRALAKQYHPDTSSGETGAAMTQINEAYETLSDDHTRQIYDATFTTMKGD